MRVSFTPPDEKLYSTVLLVRNNLTVIDKVLVKGRGGRGFLKFANRKPGSAMPLAFNIGAKHLKDCDSKWHCTCCLSFRFICDHLCCLKQITKYLLKTLFGMSRSGGLLVFNKSLICFQSDLL